MSNRYLLLVRQTLTSDTGFLLITTVSGYSFTYLYLLLMGRFLGPEAFGTLGAMFAIFYIACMVGQSLREAIAANIAEIKAKADEATSASTFVRLGVKIGILCTIPTVVFIVAARPIAAYFHVTSVWPVIILAFSLFTALALDIILGLQQGLQKFKQLGVTGYSVSQGLKLVLGVPLVLAGLGLNGAVGSLLGSTTIATILGLILTWKLLSIGARNSVKYEPKLSPILIPALILAIFIAMPASVDVMLVTHYFGGKTAGLYHAIATVGKVVIFLPMAVSFVLLSRAKESHVLGNDTGGLLLKSLGLTLLLSGGIATVCWAFPGTAIELFFGEAYIDAAALIGLYTAAMLFFSLNVVFIHYSLSIGNLWIMLIADLVTVFEVIAIVLIHESLFQIIWILIWGNLLILLLNCVYFLYRFLRLRSGHGRTL